MRPLFVRFGGIFFSLQEVGLILHLGHAHCGVQGNTENGKDAP